MAKIESKDIGTHYRLEETNVSTLEKATLEENELEEVEFEEIEYDKHEFDSGGSSTVTFRTNDNKLHQVSRENMDAFKEKYGHLNPYSKFEWDFGGSTITFVGESNRYFDVSTFDDAHKTNIFVIRTFFNTCSSLSK